MRPEPAPPAPLASPPAAYHAAGADAVAPAATSDAVAAWAARAREATRHDTLLRRFLARAAAHPDRPALQLLAAGGAPADATVTWGEWATLARAVAAALVAGGVAPGDRVAIVAGNGALWPIADVGVLLAGAVSVGVPPTSTAAQARALLADVEPRVVLVDAVAQLDQMVGRGADEVPTVAGAPTLVVSAEPTAGAAAAVAWHDWLASGARALDDPATAREVDRRLAAARPDDLAVVIHTSGSTGEPKGACLTHACLLASAESIRDTLGLTDADRALALLPYAHAAERVFGHCTRIVCGMTAGLVADASRTWAAARAFRPTLFGGLPRFYEKLYAALPPGDGAAARAAVAAHLGGAVRLATSGGAPLPATVAAALADVGLPVLGAYGQTEHLCLAFQRPGEAPAGVGRPMPGTEVRIADDGEILVRRSALTFAGYWRRPDATRAAFTADGVWLRTGDLGALDAAGRLHVTGRTRELIALSTGRKVAPLPIEARLAAHPAVAQAVVVGEGRRFAGALLFVGPEALGGAAADALRAEVTALVARANADAAPHERIVRWALVAGELTEAAGELTPTLKVRRAVVAERYADRVEALYA